MISGTDFLYWVFLPHVFYFLVGAVILLMSRQWNIPVAILRFTGDKRRPTLILRKAKKKIIQGVPHLWVKGYKSAMRDFLAENYYPSPKSQWGGLVLFEFEDGWLTPLRPAWNKLSKEHKAECRKLLDALLQKMNVHRVADFEYDKILHDRLKLKIVDDVDADFYLQEQSRQDTQYTSGWSHWFKQHFSTITILFIFILIFAGFIVWLDKAPQTGAICAQEAASKWFELWMQNTTASMAPAG